MFRSQLYGLNLL
uniref:Uncharacterized protein n=1 Tax=Anguilla anguilla TaxID=7936 RepID=A0A0E9UIN3_ANGAN